VLDAERASRSLPLSASPPNAGQLPAPEPLPRELSDVEIVSLVSAATDNARLAVVGLLMGLSEKELIALPWENVDLPANLIRVSGEATRSVPLTEPLYGLLVSRRRADADAVLVLHDAEGGELEASDISRLVLFAAYDAALDRPDEISPAALRYTYLCSLVRQGIRAADIAGVMGHLPQRELTTCIQLHAPRERRPLELIDRVLPSLRQLAGDAGG
jgi:integrase